MRPKDSTAALMVAAAFSVFATCFLKCGDAAEPMAAEVIAAADLYGKQRQELGRRLTAIVADEQATSHERIRAAELLGRLHYTPAIPVLIRHIEWMPSGIGSDMIGPPMAVALSVYGDAAVPSVIEAYLNRKAQPSDMAQGAEFAFIVATGEGRTRERARTYIKGKRAETQDPEKRRRIEAFLNFGAEFGFNTER